MLKITIFNNGVFHSGGEASAPYEYTPDIDNLTIN
jgi:hypothetical protein